ncbi:hypothetical protein BAUCODRAFT_398814 [Baudoinia panamericana UAMH 10762]|uniref:Single-strand DNA deaminase toxin A-like C-terminal domain-containing protein n=1 Tax=Baudoinia panamericana (strain UAMH 10762) TaxID=717646 RepID=M2LX91_BAUPA|nr:uncharacterized protein BAUCODRAFT_398814 [Baudoinia panamericana UAMH 10762]EMC99312.1 hypothetical protein BAUCODRAFT_398814 [Baudoinia panamericana UAMH 10762]
MSEKSIDKALLGIKTAITAASEFTGPSEQHECKVTVNDTPADTKACEDSSGADLDAINSALQDISLHAPSVSPEKVPCESFCLAGQPHDGLEVHVHSDKPYDVTTGERDCQNDPLLGRVAVEGQLVAIILKDWRVEQRLYANGASLDAEFVRRIQLSAQNIPMSKNGYKTYKTVALAIQHQGLEPIITMSGWKPHALPASCGVQASDVLRPLVFELAKKVHHAFDPEPVKDGGLRGSFHACHAEKQVLTKFIDEQAPGFILGPAGSNDALTPDLSQSYIHICIYQQHSKNPIYCDDCLLFIRRVCEATKLYVTLWSSTPGSGSAEVGARYCRSFPGYARVKTTPGAVGSLPRPPKRRVRTIKM